MRSWKREQRQIFEAGSWKQVTGPSGAVACETRNFASYWHTPRFEIRVVNTICPQDAKKLLLRQAKRGRSWLPSMSVKS